ncbi:hypothetical protein J7E97_08860 [Streptomyces sp. ISL-66]|uniref:hypothetical protein n=1 Tax=Streptomyces sp. ISL-66 TaxID=2819186 RepID=UPI001BEAEAE8|nr:hypothetical protein [Streptomyces sp. ISL-66]MBT2467986.1 hypothetical protein [Streptomyces sp. ISL-66]
MSNAPRQPLRRPLAALALAGIAMAAWAAWLGWDQHPDVHPDGSTTGPYQAWQVIGLGLTLLVPVYWAASRKQVEAAVFGTTAGLAVAAAYDWSDDGSGLFLIGVAMVTAGSLAVTGVLSLVIASAKRNTGGGRPGH